MFKDIKRIEASLSYGRLLWGRNYLILLILLIASLLIPIITLIISIMVKLNIMYWEANMILALIIANIFSSFLISFSVGAFVIDFRKKKNLKLILNESVELTATVKKKSITFVGENPYRVTVLFFIDGKLYKRDSPQGNSIVGYSKFFLKYISNNVNILYSPKNDEVMFLKAKGIKN